MADRRALRDRRRSSCPPRSSSPAASTASSPSSTCCRSSRRARCSSAAAGCRSRRSARCCSSAWWSRSTSARSGYLALPFGTRSRRICRRPTSRSTRSALNVFGFFAVALLSGSLAERARRGEAQLEQATEEIADLQAFNQYVIDNLLSGLATADAENRLLTFNRSAMLITGRDGALPIGEPAADVLQLPPAFAATIDEDLARVRSKRMDYVFTPPDGRVIDLGLSVGGTAAARRLARLSLHVPGRHRHQAVRAERAPAAAPRRGRRDGGRHRARDPQSAGVDVGLDADAAAGAGALGRPGAADGHRAQGVGTPEPDHQVVSRLRAAAALFSCSGSISGPIVQETAMLLRNSPEVERAAHRRRAAGRSTR